ncbi:MAG: TPR repeat protein [Methylophilaceae bacterium]|jgi:TPR repeat protein
MKKLIGVLVLGLMLSMAVHADQFDDALEVYSKGSYKQAYKSFLLLAKQGDVRAQESLGDMYRKGIGVP